MLFGYHIFLFNSIFEHSLPTLLSYTSFTRFDFFRRIFLCRFFPNAEAGFPYLEQVPGIAQSLSDFLTKDMVFMLEYGHSIRK